LGTEYMDNIGWYRLVLGHLWSCA